MTVANNIALLLVNSSIDASKRSKFRERVIASNGDLFNHIRASLQKADELVAQNQAHKITSKERRFLSDAYSYLYSQRLAMFDMCHRILWKLSCKENKLSTLFRLFRFSSFIWRIFGRNAEEQKYLHELHTLVPNPEESIENQETIYFRIRLLDTTEL